MNTIPHENIVTEGTQRVGLGDGLKWILSFIMGIAFGLIGGYLYVDFKQWVDLPTASFLDFFIIFCFFFFGMPLLHGAYQIGRRRSQEHFSGAMFGFETGMNMIKDIFVRESQHIRQLERQSTNRIDERARRQIQPGPAQAPPQVIITDGNHATDPFDSPLDL